MKRFLTTIIACAAMLVFGHVASAQIDGPAVTAGYTSSVAATDLGAASSISAYHFGLTRKFNMGLGFAIQPSAVYQVKGTALEDVQNEMKYPVLDMSVGYFEIPCQFQWGPDLMAFRPYVLVEPFIGFGVTMDAKSDFYSEALKGFKNVNMSRWEYGFGIGGGIEVWRFQISGKYFWNFGGLCDAEGNINPSNISNTIRSAFENQRGFNGFNVSLSFFFGPRN